MKDKTKKNILKFVSYYIFIFIILSVTILMVIQLSVIYLEIINYNLDLVGIINVSLITILVLITGAYGYFTWQIVDDQKKSRQIDYTSKRLEKFYYQVLNFLNSYIYMVSVDSKPELRVRDNIFDIERRNSNPDYKDIVRHQYLMKNNQTKYLFGEFVEKVLKSHRAQDKEVIDLYDRFKKIVEQDIEMYENELNELTMK